jgi:hypothetical protein
VQHFAPRGGNGLDPIKHDRSPIGCVDPR